MLDASLLAAEQRVLTLVRAARRIADPADALGIEARRELPASTGLSAEGVELALEHSLELDPSPAELSALCQSVPNTAAAHVLLSANVFVAAHRAIALGLAASPRVEVRASRREPHMARLLAEGAPGLFRLSAELAPNPGDQLFAYGSDETLRELARTLPDGVVLHAHGAGFGLAIAEHGRSDPGRVANKLALDIALFDQRGCLSPRALLVVGGPAAPYARALARALAELESNVPRGRLDADELSAASRFRDAMLFAGEVAVAGQGHVSFAAGGALVIAPVGRNCHVLSCTDPMPLLEPHTALLTSLGLDVGAALESRLRASLPGARLGPLGRMQAPPFDGPVDRRSSALRD